MAGRNLNLADRKVGIRNKIEVEVFELKDVDGHFDENIHSIEQKFEVANGLINEGKVNEARDIWRSQIVFLDSAFDFYLHEVVKIGILSIYHNEWEKTEKYSKLVFNMADLDNALLDVDDDTWLKDWINRKYASETLMSYKAFKDVCNLLGLCVNSIADAVYYQQGSKEKTIDKLRNKLEDLFKRRNLIAHQMDSLHENAERQEITEADVRAFLVDMKKIVLAVSTEVSKRWNDI